MMLQDESAPRATPGPAIAPPLKTGQPPPKAGGFTILEIMIAVAILVFGILGILAIFPAAIWSGKRSIEETTSSLIAQSVEQAIREGIVHRRGQSPDGKWDYFLFQYDGVQDPLPRRTSDAWNQAGADYFILLPQTNTDDLKTAGQRQEVYQRGKVFIYPETDGKSWSLQSDDGFTGEYSDSTSGAQPNGGGNPEQADDDLDDVPNAGTLAPGEYAVLKTYQLGDSLIPDGMSFGEYAATLNKEAKEALQETRNYSFAFAIRRAFNDSSLGRHSPISLPQRGDDTRLQHQIIPGNELFEVTIMIFRSFRPETNKAKPVYKSTVLVAK